VNQNQIITKALKNFSKANPHITQCRVRPLAEEVCTLCRERFEGYVSQDRFDAKSKRVIELESQLQKSRKQLSNLRSILTMLKVNFDKELDEGD